MRGMQASQTRVDEFGKQFPADWRKMVAGDNAEHLKTLDRFTTPKALYESYAALRGKLSSGELRPVTAFPDKGTPEEQAVWRSTNGVPEKADAYRLKLPEKLTDDDKAIVGKMQERAFANHMPAAQAQVGADWFFDEKKNRVEARLQKDQEFAQQSDDAMRAKWGNDYRPNLNRISALLDTGPQGIREMLGKARLGDGTLLGDHPAWVEFFGDLARQMIPAGVMLPGDGANLATSIADEITKLETYMKEQRSKYNKDEPAQKRLRELYGARDRMGAKKKAA